MRKKIRIYFLVSLITLAVALVGCSSKSTDTAKNALYHKTDVTGPAASFDWNAKVGPVSYEKTYVETNSGKEVTTTLDGVKKAADDLEKKKKEITNPKVQAALKLVDAVFVNQKNFDLVLKSRGASNQEEFLISYGMMS